MTRFFHIVPVAALVALAGCSSAGQSPRYANTAPVSAPMMEPAPLPTITPAQTTADARAQTDVRPFLDPQAIAALTPSSLNQAAGAQFNALQFGRPGAPRNWQGDGGASGEVTVGPPLNVNSLYCRTFTHSVKVGGKDYPKRGMACREADGRWSVDGSSTG